MTTTQAAQDWKSQQAARDFAAKQMQIAFPHLVPGHGHVVAAKNMRIELQRAFPGVKFSVRSKSFSMGNDVRVSWTDGPSVAQVDAIINKYAGGSFDGMTDCYNYERGAWTDAFGEAKYVFSERAFSDKTIAGCIRTVWSVRFPGNLKDTAQPTVEQFRSGELYNAEVPGLGGVLAYNNIQSLIHRELAGRTCAIAKA